MVPVFEQAGYAFYSDDGGEAASTILGVKDTPVALQYRVPYHVRILIKETNGVAFSLGGSPSLFWEYSLNGGDWLQPSIFNVVTFPWNSTHLTDVEDTTQRIGSGTFVTPNGGVKETIPPVLSTIGYAGNDECEVVLSFRPLIGTGAGAAKVGDTVRMRISGLDTYTLFPTFTIVGFGSQPVADFEDTETFAEFF
jgi:hypothetical protein